MLCQKNPMQLRPVVSCINSFSSIFSTWLNFKLNKLLRLIPFYIKNSTDLIKELKQLDLPPGNSRCHFYVHQLRHHYRSPSIKTIIPNIQQSHPSQLSKSIFSNISWNCHEKQYLHVWWYIVVATTRYCRGHTCSSSLLNSYYIYKLSGLTD